VNPFCVRFQKDEAKSETNPKSESSNIKNQLAVVVLSFADFAFLKRHTQFLFQVANLPGRGMNINPRPAGTPLPDALESEFELVAVVLRRQPGIFLEQAAKRAFIIIADLVHDF